MSEELLPCHHKSPTMGIDHCMLGDPLQGCTKNIKEQAECDLRLYAEQNTRKKVKGYNEQTI